jgi:20S proteasome alpha/beta subunit
MTLIAAFRCKNNGVLLCADREENDGYSKRSVDKIFRISHLQYQVFIAGAGAGAVITKACIAIEEELRKAAAAGADLILGHKDLLEGTIESVYSRYVKTQQDEIGLLIVIVFESGNRVPQLYTTQSAMLVPESLYAAHGTGKVISDFLADRLYQHGVGKRQLMLLAALIFREAGKASASVGLGCDMVVIYDGDRAMQFFGPDSIKEIEAGLPEIGESVYSHWKEHVKVPDWLRE